MSPWDEGRTLMSKEERHLLADLFQRACGFVLREDLKFVAERRLATRLELLGLRDFGAYARYLKFDPKGAEELELAVDLLVPHETYFFREQTQLACFEAELVPQLAARNALTKSLRVWSAGCASGEEPYTLAMLLLGAPKLAGWSIEVLGTDLSKKSLVAGRRAEYGLTSLRSTSEARQKAFFDPLEAGRVRVKDEVRAHVRFGQLNLVDGSAAGVLPRFDVIFCRNTLMYFDVSTRKRVVERFFDHLVEGGFLLLGHSENLLTLSTRFEFVQLEGDLVYRRPGP